MHLGSFVTASNIQTVLQLCSLAISSAFLHFTSASSIQILNPNSFAVLPNSFMLKFCIFIISNSWITFAVSASDTQIVGSKHCYSNTYTYTYTYTYIHIHIYMLKFCIFDNTCLNFAVSASENQIVGSEHRFPPTRLTADEAGEAFAKPPENSKDNAKNDEDPAKDDQHK